MLDPQIRFYHRQPSGEITATGHNMPLSDFAGFLPHVGDLILKAGVPTDLVRSDPKNRAFLLVVQRIFNPRDEKDIVAIVVEDREITEVDSQILPPS